jgi:hypothetical protein
MRQSEILQLRGWIAKETILILVRKYLTHNYL